MRRIGHDTYSLIFSVAYLGLMTNAMLLLVCSPLVAVLVLTDPALTWPLAVLFAPLLAPAGIAAFTTFRRFTDDGSTDVARGFLRAWWGSLRKGLLWGALAALGLAVIIGDIHVVGRTSAAALAIPLLMVLGVLFVVWANGRYCLRPAIVEPAAGTDRVHAGI